jgi:hypothetical protein
MTPACHGNPAPFDTLIDHSQGVEHRAAVREAWAMCRECPLLAACHAENAGERWVHALLGVKREPVDRPSCGRRSGARQHTVNGERQCEACRECSRRHYKRRSETGAPIQHGTDTGYSRHRKAGEEACEPCKEAHRTMERLRAARKREGAAA